MALRFPVQHSIKHLAFASKAAVVNRLTPHCASTKTLHLPCTLNGRRMSASTHLTSSVPLPHAVSSGSAEEDVLVGFVMGRRKATELAHSIWKNVVKIGDTVVDATCGNGYDTLALLKMVADETNSGFVYGMDIQNSALENTSSLLDESVTANERKNVKLFHLCHSKMEDVIPKNVDVRVITFNMGYLPGGDKDIITVPTTTLLALQAAARILARGGLISVVVYVGHPGGREELETVQSFASSLLPDDWVSCKFEVLNRPNAPMLVLLFRK